MTKEAMIRKIMNTPEGYESFRRWGNGRTYYDYITFIITEYLRISVNVMA